MLAADRANAYVDSMEPWKLAKGGASHASRLRDVASVAINLYRQLIVYLSPVLPSLADQTSVLVGGLIQSWDDSQHPMEGVAVGTFQPLMRRVEEQDVEAMVAQTKQIQELDMNDPILAEKSNQSIDSGESLAAEPLAAECSIDDFSKVDLRVARIVSAEEVPEAKKLLKLTVSLGGDATRTVFAGIKGFHAPESLVGRLVIVVANLAARQMRFGMSEGMVVAASGAGGPGVYLLSPDTGATPGMRLR